MHAPIYHGEAKSFSLTLSPESLRMKSKPWLRLYTDIIDDEKLGLVAFEDRWHYIAFLACKGKGLLDRNEDQELTRRKVALKLGLSTRELDEVVRRLAEVGLLERETMQPVGWDERQFLSDSSTDRVRAFRERTSGKEDGNADETFQKRPKRQNTETDTETDTKKKPGRPAAPEPVVLPECIPQESWDAWMAYRKRRRLSTVEATMQGQVRRLTEWSSRGHSPAEIIRESIDNGWQGLFEPKVRSQPLARHTGLSTGRNYSEGIGDDGSFR